MPSTPEAVAWAGDVAVIGAGAAGVLVASELAAQGLEVTLVEAGGFGARQSNHSHGYLHRGYIYHQPTPQLVSEFSRGAERWLSLLESAGCRPVTRTSSVAFHNAVNARRVSDYWTAAGLRVELASIPQRFRPETVAATFTTVEPVYAFTSWFEHARKHSLRDVRTVKASVRRLIGDRGGIEALELRRHGELLHVKAGFYVLAAGTSNLDLIAPITRMRGRVVNRTSYMLVIQAPLPVQSVVMHGHEAHGLFMASRPGPGAEHATWLISDYVSYAAELNSVLGGALWTRGLARILRRFTDVLDRDDFRWGFYTAPKGELRQEPRVLSQQSIETYGMRNCLVASPSKLTLAPLLADLVVSAVTRRRIRPPRSLAEVVPTDDLTVVEERWTSVPLRPAPTLSRLIDSDHLDLEEVIEVVQ